MADDAALDGTYTLHEIVRAVDAHQQTLSLYNFDGPDRVLDALSNYFSDQSVRLRRVSTSDRQPTNFLVLHRGDQFVAAASLDAVYDVVRGDETIVDPTSFQTLDYPDVIEQIDQTTFTGYDERRLVGVSRGYERFAWERGGGSIHAGFQRLSRLRPQLDVYQSLAERGVDVHVYGKEDDSVPDDRFTVHASDAEEITRSWFVAYEGPAGAHRGLLAWERVPNDFHGVWTSQKHVVDAILARLRAEHPSHPQT